MSSNFKRRLDKLEQQQSASSRMGDLHMGVVCFRLMGGGKLDAETEERLKRLRDSAGTESPIIRQPRPKRETVEEKLQRLLRDGAETSKAEASGAT